MVLISTISWPLTGWARRPSSSTRFRFGPRPRRLRNEAPGVWEALGWPAAAWPIWLFTSAWNCGSWLRFCSISGPARFSKVWELTVTIGLGAVKSRRAMREPVTTTSPTTWLLSGGVLLWACAAPPAMATPANMVEPTSIARVTRRPNKIDCIVQVLPRVTWVAPPQRRPDFRRRPPEAPLIAKYRGPHVREAFVSASLISKD